MPVEIQLLRSWILSPSSNQATVIPAEGSTFLFRVSHRYFQPCPFSNFYFLFSKGGRSFPAASFASSLSRPLSSSALKRPSRYSPRSKSSARPLLRITFRACGHQVTVAAAPSPHSRHHMVDAPQHRRQPPQAVEAESALARVDRVAQRPRFQEVRLLEIARAGYTLRGRRCDFVNLQLTWPDLIGKIPTLSGAQIPTWSELSTSVVGPLFSLFSNFYFLVSPVSFLAHTGLIPAFASPRFRALNVLPLPVRRLYLRTGDFHSKGKRGWRAAQQRERAGGIRAVPGRIRVRRIRMQREARYRASLRN